MDANGLKFWLLADKSHWHLAGEPPALEYDSSRRSLRLARQRRDLDLTEDRAEAQSRLEKIPRARDAHGNLAWWDGEWHRILAAGVERPEQVIFSFSQEVELTDMAMGDDGVLYMAAGGAVVMHDRRQRWPDAVVSLDGFQAWRLTPAPHGGCWVLDRSIRALARLTGTPLPGLVFDPGSPETVRPCEENADPPRLVVMERINWPAQETPVALSCSLRGELVCLSWMDSGAAVVRRLTEGFELSPPMRLLGTRFPYSLAWVDSSQVAVLVCGRAMEGPVSRIRNEARVYRVEAGAPARFPSGDLYPLKPDYNFGPFVHGLDVPPHYPAFNTSHALHRLSFPFFTRQGQAFNAGQDRQLDSAGAGSVWHRLYIEASIPAGCGIRIWLAAADEAQDHINGAALQWFEHRFGQLYEQGAPEDVPVGCWVPQPSELPHHPGLLPCDLEPGRKGLFTVLVQRSGLRVRSLSGRHLYVKVELNGPGNATPELLAVRAYAGRFSYLEHYLPRLYREQTFGPEADQAGRATPADFLERFINNFEGIFTTIEDRVACSDLVTRPHTAPPDALEWLSTWIGLQLEPGWTEDQQRRFLENGAELYRWHGTMRGLNLALEIATHGGVSRGDVVVLEDFRLRRTFTTIIGADLEEAEDPLTLGGGETGNSFVGDTLFIGDEQRREFLALFSADLEVSAAEQAAMAAFFDRLAFRVSILVRLDLSSHDLGMIQHIAEREIPAHVLFRVLPASARLLIGISSLVGVDTTLGLKPSPRPARVNRSTIGRGDFVMGPATLDPRLEGIGSGLPEMPEQKPIARARDLAAAYGEDFTLDGSDSEAASGRRLTAYRWSFPNPDDNQGDSQ